MARLARVVVPGQPHHITQRGVRRMDVFFSDEDRSIYLAALGETVTRYGWICHAYCLHG